jgi:O-antigen/teichoic acid export membrane protein
VTAFTALIRRLGGGADGDVSHGHLFRSTHALMLTTVVNGALGFGFWVLAARLYTPELVGINSALIAVMTTIATLAQFSFGVMFIRFLPESSRPRQMILIGYALSAGTAVVIAVLLAIVVPRISGDLSVLRTHPWLAAAWVASVALWCVFGLQDRALTALRFTRWVPVENGIFGAAKIVVLLSLAAVGAAQGILFAWIIPMVLLIVPVNWLLFGPAARRHTPIHQDGVVRSFGRRRVLHFLGLTGVATVFDQGMQAAIPLLVVGILGPTQNAYFYIPFAIVMTVEILIDSGSVALTVEGSFAATRLRELTVSVVRRLLTLVSPVIVALIIFAPFVLVFFGADYVEHSTTVLRLLVLATVLRGAIGVFVGVCRVQGRAVVIFVQSLATSVLGVAFIAVGAHVGGLNGVGVGWLAANAVVAVALLPMFWRYLRSSRPTAADRGDEIPGSAGVDDGRAAYYPSSVWGGLVPPEQSIGAIDQSALDDDVRRPPATETDIGEGRPGHDIGH